MKSAERSVIFLAKHLDSGGVTTHMMTLAKGLQERGWKVSLVSAGAVGNHHHTPEWFETEGIRHYHFEFVKDDPVHTLAWYPISLLRFRRIIDAERPNLLHVHWRSTSLYAKFIELTRGIPFVSTLHSNNIPAGFFFRTVSFWGERAIAISSETREYLKSAFGVSASKIVTIFHGVDTTRFRVPDLEERARARARFGIVPELPVVSLVGRLEPVKRHDLALKAMLHLRKRGLEIQLIFAGEGSLRRKLEETCIEWGIRHRVHFVGFTDVREVYWASDICILPSDNEGFGLTMVEAMACGVPVIRTIGPGANDQVQDGVTGYLIPPGDSKAMADRIANLITNLDVYSRFSQAAKLYAEQHFSHARMVEQTISVYESVLANVRAISSA